VNELRRAVAAVALLGAVAAVVLAERSSDGDRSARPDGAPALASAAAMPRADPPGALSTTWFCAGSRAGRRGAADLSVVVANPGGEVRRGTITWVPSSGEPVVEALAVAPHGVEARQARDAVEAPAVSAQVDLRGGGVVVEHAVASSTGSSQAPCASRASDRWYLANGATTRDARQSLALYNPFADDAIVDVSVVTPEGREAPPRLQGLPLAGRSTTKVELSEVVRREPVTAVAVVARSGRLVVDRLQRFDGSDDRAGLALTLAAPAPAPVWSFPDGRRDDDTDERWHVANPGGEEALVALEVVPEDAPAPAPLELTVPAGGRATISAEDVPGLPEGSHTSTVRALNATEVVAERELVVERRGGRGWSSVLGSPLRADRWALAAGEVSDEVGEVVVVGNPGSTPVTVSVAALRRGEAQLLDGMDDLRLGPAGRVALRLRDAVEADRLPVVVVGDGPIVVERSLEATDGGAFSRAIGIPLP